MIIIAGIAFPVAGVGLLRLNLLPLRFMLMHSAILGGVVALALNTNALITTAVINLVLTLVVAATARSMRVDVGYMSMFFMVVSISLAFILLYKYNIMAKDMMTVLWGSIYSSSWIEVASIVGFSLCLLLFQWRFFRQLQAFYFDREVAFTAGVNVRFLYYSNVILTALTIAMAMKIIGAMLLDALLLLPPLIASFHARSARAVFICSSLWGFVFSSTGYFAALSLDIPISSAIAAIASVTFALVFILHKTKKNVQ
jgi:zinc transport system permease protein